MSSGNHKATALIVDDNPEMRLFLRRALEVLVLEIFEAADGLKAMTVLEKKKPSLLLTDYQMPGWDGMTVVQQIRQHPDLRHIKIIMLTGEVGSPFLLQAVNHRVVDAAVIKPVDLNELRQLVTRLLGLDVGPIHA
ncbi:MAG: response regulator [Gaiellales bacterium]|nr:MAG: response regulator [Gaiellales bacterium]